MRPLIRLFVALALLSVAASCRSTQSAYRFRPAATPAVVRPSGATDSVAAREVAALRPTTPPPLYRVQAPQARRAAAATQRAWPRPAAKRGRALARQAGQKRPARVVWHALRRPVAAPRNTTEVGLGTTFFGVLGLIVVPISLIGLLLSGGGLVWGILAAAGALAVFIAWLDPYA